MKKSLITLTLLSFMLHAEEQPRQRLDLRGFKTFKMIYDPGDVFGGRMTASFPTLLQLEREGVLTLKFSDESKERKFQLSPTESAELQDQIRFTFQFKATVGAFPCTGKNAVGSAGLPAKNYLWIDDQGNKTIFPTFCIESDGRQNLEEFSHLLTVMVLRRKP